MTKTSRQIFKLCAHLWETLRTSFGSSPKSSGSTAFLFHRYRFGQISRLVYILAFANGYMVGQ